MNNSAGILIGLTQLLPRVARKPEQSTAVGAAAKLENGKILIIRLPVRFQKNLF